MDEKQNKAWKVGDLKLSPTQQNSGVVVKRAGSAYIPETTLAAFTTPAEMIAWLAEQYGVEIKPRGAPSRSPNLTATEILAGFAAYGKHPAIKALEEAEAASFVPSGNISEMAERLHRDAERKKANIAAPAPRYQWKTREDFVAALTMALTVRGFPASMAPGQHARGIADIIDSVHAQGIGE